MPKSPYLNNDMTGQPIDRYIGASHVDAQSVCQVIAKCVKITLRFLDLGELLGATSFCDEVNWQLVGAGATDKVGEVGEL